VRISCGRRILSCGGVVAAGSRIRSDSDGHVGSTTLLAEMIFGLVGVIMGQCDLISFSSPSQASGIVWLLRKNWA